MKSSLRRTLAPRLAALVMLALASLSCTWTLIDWGQLIQPSTPVPGNATPTATPAPLAEITFNAAISAPLPPGDALALGIVDEVTGLALNPQFFPMTGVDAQHYTLKLKLPLGTVVKYRYYRQGSTTVQEDTTNGTLVRYRLYKVDGPASVDDVVASWSDQPFSGGTGRITGTVMDASSGRPIPNVMVAAGGLSTLTDSLGQYILDGLPAGTHNLVAYSLDGAYTIFQQGATVETGRTTTAPLSLSPVPTVRVTFVATLPKDTVTGAPVRLAGNLLQLGNTFADLSGGVNTIATRMPTLSPLSDGRQTLTLSLPVGADIRYKYTLGDGFWNAEHDSNGNFVLHELIVPKTDTVIQDKVDTWEAGPSAPILFDVTVPSNTPTTDTVSIQFNPYGWTEPIPMWPLGNNRWAYKLFGPLNMLGSFHYRYCRNDQCGSADDQATAGTAALSRSVATSLTGETIQENVNAWQWWPESEPATLVAVSVNPRQAGFWAGVEFQSHYQPNWQALLPAAMQNVQALGANYVVLTPSWTATSSNPLAFAPTPGDDPLWNDTLQAVQYARAQALSVAIYATPHLLPSTADFWQKAPRTPDWWNSWFERYRAFALYHADLATASGAQALILGGDTVLPALPDGVLPDGSLSGVPADAATRWASLIQEVRQHFSGQILWAIPYRDKMPASPPAFSNQLDAFYILWSAPLAANGPATPDAMTTEALNRLDNDILPFLVSAKKPGVLAVDYPSAQGAAQGCVPAEGNGCLDFDALSRPFPDIPSVSLDLKGQADLYQAILQAVNQRDWVSGVISRGYYPPAALMDKSTSVHGKAAADLLWYWFPRFQGH